MPHRGKRNEPAFVRHTAEVVAGLKDMPPQDLMDQTARNFPPVPPRRRRDTGGCRRNRLMRVTVLGCGGSSGVPLATGDWGACNPRNPRNRRRRASILVRSERGTRILVDASPDLREQALSVGGLPQLDAVLFTHAHADHCHGIDDLRALTAGRAPLAACADPDTLAILHRRFGYGFVEIAGLDSYGPRLAGAAIAGPFSVGDVDVVPFWQEHGPRRSLGFRFGPIAYSTDLNQLDETAFAILDGVDVWIVDCLRMEPHGTHSHFAQTLDWIARVRPRRAILTHMNHTMDYDTVAALCPSNRAGLRRACGHAAAMPQIRFDAATPLGGGGLRRVA
ncbi:MAG: MBL fold metallo-hydrolase [Alphaproteobacteria bacterium]